MVSSDPRSGTYVWRAQLDGFHALLSPRVYVLRGHVNTGEGSVQRAPIAIEILSFQ